MPRFLKHPHLPGATAGGVDSSRGGGSTVGLLLLFWIFMWGSTPASSAVKRSMRATALSICELVFVFGFASLTDVLFIPVCTAMPATFIFQLTCHFDLHGFLFCCWMVAWHEPLAICSSDISWLNLYGKWTCCDSSNFQALSQGHTCRALL